MTKAEALAALGSARKPLPFGIHQVVFTQLDDAISNKSGFMGYNIQVTIPALNNRVCTFFQGLAGIPFLTEQLQANLDLPTDDHEEVIKGAIESGMLLTINVTPYVNDDGKQFPNVAVLSSATSASSASDKPAIRDLKSLKKA